MKIYCYRETSAGALVSTSFHEVCTVSLTVLNLFQMTNQYKVGVLYCKDGQSTEEEMYNNRKSSIVV